MSEDKGIKCEGCGKTFSTAEFEANLYVCPKCGSHEKMPARKRIETTVDEGSFVEMWGDLVSTDILEFTDSGFLFCYKLKKAQPDCKAIILTNAAAKVGLHFELSSPDAREWIKADSILEKSIRAEQLDREIARIMSR